MNLKERAKALMTDIPAIFLSLKSKETPFLAKVLAFIIIGYALSPIDLIPDFIPVLGYLDDVLILPLLITVVIKMIPVDTFDKYRREASGMWNEGKPKRWYFAIPIILTWVFLIWIVLRIIG